MRPDQYRSDLGSLRGANTISDRYQSFAQLAAHETEGVDYAICLVERPSRVAVLAPHGGHIEPATSLIAAAIAGNDHSLYSFEGLSPLRPHGDLHLTSTCFDEPQALALAARSQVVITVHGYLEAAPDAPVLLGGLDTTLIQLIARELMAAGFAASTADHRFPATNPANICNRSGRAAGAQLELPRGLRDRFLDNAPALASFAAAVRRGIAADGPAAQ